MMGEPYFTFNREERNLAALLYHLLLIGEDNLAWFLEHVEHTAERPLSECEIYYEYAMLRDQWHHMDHGKKRTWVTKRLPKGVQPPSEEKGVRAWNEFFGLVNKPSNEFIQSPANWVLSRIDDSVQGTDFHDLALLKWSFNIKPDLVIITGDKRGVCIEAKVESSAGKYPTSSADKEAWHSRGAGSFVDQMECQRNLFEKVLEYPKEYPKGDMEYQSSPLRFVLLDQKGKGRSDVKGLSWSEVFNAMDKSESHNKVKSWLQRYEQA